MRIKAYSAESAAWEQLKGIKRAADREKRGGVLRAETIQALNRAYMVLRSIQINEKGKQDEKTS
jgi:hypothetical protein